MIGANEIGPRRFETVQGRQYLVAPVRMIVEGVLAGSNGPILYQADDMAADPQAWNGMPFVLGHPQDNEGNFISARSPGVADTYEIGRVYNVEFKTIEREGQDPLAVLDGEAWVDVALVKKRDAEQGTNAYERLKSGDKIETSTGLFTDDEDAAEDATYNGTPYQAIARNYRPDHLALLLDQPGACSIKDGCGVNVNASDFFFSCERDGDGRCLPGGGGSSGSSKDESKGKGVGTKIKEKIAAKYAKFEGRYGRTGAIAIMAGMAALAAVPVPGTSLVPIAIAEGVHQIRKLGKGKGTKNARRSGESFDIDRLVDDAIESLKEAYKDQGEDPPEFDREVARKAIQAELDSDSELDATINQRQSLWRRLGEMLGIIRNEVSDNAQTPQPTNNEQRPDPIKVIPTIRQPQGDRPMAFDRKKSISYLTANCDCWKGGEATLAKMSDKQIQSLVGNAKLTIVVNAYKKGGMKALKNNEDGEGEVAGIDIAELAKFLGITADPASDPVAFINELKTALDGISKRIGGGAEAKPPVAAEETPPEEVEEEEPAAMEETPTEDKPEAPATNRKRKPQSLATWEASMPPEARAVWNAAKATEAKERNRLTKRLKAIAANSAPKRKAMIEGKLKANLAVDALQELLDLVEPVANEFAGNERSEYLPSAPDAREITDNSDDEPLDFPTINWAEEYANRRQVASA